MSFLKKQYDQLLELGYIDNALYDKYAVKRGLRNSNGTGVLVGLTKVSDVKGYDMVDGKVIEAEGHLYYRDIDLFALAKKDNDVYGFEKTAFLLLFSHYPNQKEFEQFTKILKSKYELPQHFIEQVIMNNPSKNIMNNLQKSLLSLYSYDQKDPDSTDPYEILKKSISIIAKMPAIIAYSYQAKAHYHDNESLYLHYINSDLSIAEQILYLIRKDSKYTKTEADTLDTALIVHADHGGGNNSTFTNTVVATTQTDIYSILTAGLSSLKGPRHGGANIMVVNMMEEIINEIGLKASDKDIEAIIDRLLNKDFFDKAGLVYGIGHAVYTKSDPRCILLKDKCHQLALSKNNLDTFDFYSRFESIACRKLSEKMNGKAYCANVDFYSGLTYSMLGIPKDLFTAIFATARIVGWVAHNIETLLYCNKIIRPASKYVGDAELK